MCNGGGEWMFTFDGSLSRGGMRLLPFFVSRDELVEDFGSHSKGQERESLVDKRTY